MPNHRLDVLVRGGTVVDGTGAPRYRADVGAAGGRITVLPPDSGAEAADTVDAAGRIVTPGFIDVHTHSDALALDTPTGRAEPDTVERLRQGSLLQGATTEIAGNCGTSLFPVLPEHAPAVAELVSATFGLGRIEPAADFDSFAARQDPALRRTHLASLVGHGTLRAGVLGLDDRPPRPDELRTMCRLLDLALQQGAAGLSTGLIYTPGSYADTDEIVALAEVAARHGKPYVTHLRDEMAHVEAALEEALDIAARSGAALQVSHHKTAGRHGWGATERTLPRLHRAREQGIDVECDVYPYTAASTVLTAMLPPWANEGGVAALLRRLEKPELRQRIAADIEHGVPGWENTVGQGGWDRIGIAGARTRPEAEGRTVAELAAESGSDPVDLVAELLLAERGEVTVISHSMREDDVRRVLADPLSMIGSDGVPKPGRPHPRWAGSFARVLGRYRREQALVTVEQAVHKMTGKPARRFGLDGRGLIRAGARADLVVLDPETVADRADFEQPLLPPAGVHAVLVAGQVAVRDGRATAAAAGEAVRIR